MPEPFLLHHYPGSPFAEKTRLILGHKRLPWISVHIPLVMPKPDSPTLPKRGTGVDWLHIEVRDGKGGKDRVLTLPKAVAGALKEQGGQRQRGFGHGLAGVPVDCAQQFAKIGRAHV